MTTLRIGLNVHIATGHRLARMETTLFQFILTIAIAWLTFKTITRGQPNDATVSAVGIMLGLLFGVIAGFSFIAGGWWSLIGYAIFVLMLASWIKARSTIPEDIDQTLAEYETMKPELDELMAESKRVLNPPKLRLP